MLMEEEFSVKKLLQVGQSRHFVGLVLVRADTGFEALTNVSMMKTIILLHLIETCI